MLPDTGKVKLSIIIPTFNEEILIPNLLRMFDSKFKDRFIAEIIISDGGSSDNTLKLLTDEVDRVINHKEKFRQNISRGRNQGADNSLGDVLVFLNADTFIEDTTSFFEKSLEYLNQDNVSALAFPIKVFPTEEKLFDKVFHNFYNFYVRVLNKIGIGMGRGECHVIKRTVFENMNGYDENLYAGEDYDLYRRIGKRGKIKFAIDLVVYESPRRYRKLGYLKVIFNWIVNSVSVTLFRKSISKEWEPVR